MEIGEVSEYRNDDLFKKVKHINQTAKKPSEDTFSQKEFKYLDIFVLSFLGNFLIAMFSYFNKDLIFRSYKEYKFLPNMESLFILLFTTGLMTFFIVCYNHTQIVITSLLVFTFFQIVWALFTFYRSLDKGCEELFAFIMLIFSFYFLFIISMETKKPLIIVLGCLITIWNMYLQYYSLRLSEFKFKTK